MSDKDTNNQTRAGNVPSLERATKRPWSEWVSLFEERGAAKLAHPEIAKIALEYMPSDLENPEWWAQGAAIAFEQHAGIRVPGQSSTGTFRVGASRTLPLGRDEAVARWISAHGEVSEHLGHAARNVRESRTEKRTFYRFALEGAGKVEVAAALKDASDPGKSILTVQQEGLPDGDRIEEWRAYWKGLLAEL